MFKNKFYIISLLSVVVIGVLLLIAQIPTFHTAPKNLPIAIVDADQSTASQTIVKQLIKVTSTGGENPTTLKWKVLKNERLVRSEMDKEHYYGALIIKKGFANKVQSLAITQSARPEMKIIINQAKNPTVAAGVQSALTMMTNKVGTGVATQVLVNMQLHEMATPTTTSSLLSKPVDITIQTVHGLKKQINMSAIFFQPLWMGALIGSLMMFFAQKKLDVGNKRHALLTKGTELVIMTVIALVAGFGTTSVAQFISGITYENFITVALYASFASLAFLLIMFGIELWIGFGVVPLFALLMLFSAPLMSLAPEMLAHFYTSNITPWLPMRFLLDGMREIVYYHTNWWNGNTQSLAWVALIGVVLINTSIYKPKKASRHTSA